MRVRPPQHLQVPFEGGTGLLVPLAIVLPRKFQYLQVPTLSGEPNRLPVRIVV